MYVQMCACACMRVCLRMHQRARGCAWEWDRASVSAFICVNGGECKCIRVWAVSAWSYEGVSKCICVNECACECECLSSWVWVCTCECVCVRCELMWTWVRSSMSEFKSECVSACIYLFLWLSAYAHFCVYVHASMCVWLCMRVSVCILCEVQGISIITESQ